MTVHIGVVGTGAIGQDHIRRITRVLSGARVVAVNDLDPDRANTVANGVGARVLGSGAEVATDPEVDAVLVTSWGPTHAEHVLASVAAGKPVFCEKPLATEARDSLRITEAEIGHGSRLVQVGFMRRFDAGYREMKRLVDSGAVGRPLMMHCAHRNASAPPTYHSAMAAQDTAVHEIDALRWLLDDEIVSVQVLTPRPTHNREGHLQDPQILLFETAGGIRVDVEVFVNCQYGYDIQCEVVGEAGVLRLPDPPRASMRRAGDSTSGIPQDWRERFGTAFDTELQEWIDSVRTGQIGGPSAWDGYAATVITDTAVAALGSKRVLGIAMKDRPTFYA